MTTASVERIDITRSLHVTSRRYTLFDLTGEDGVVSQLSVLHRDEMLVTGRQVYDPSLEQVFPVRDPRNPSQVHRAYADPNDARRCSSRVALRAVSFYGRKSLAVSKSALWDYLVSHFPDHSFASQAAFIEALKASCRAEITATLEGRKPPSCNSVDIRKLSAADCGRAGKSSSTTATAFAWRHQSQRRRSRPSRFENAG
jgi:hypothetical protein